MPDFREAAAVTYSSVEKELAALGSEIKRVGLVIAREVTIIEKDSTREPISASMLSFLEEAAGATEEIQFHLHESKEVFRKLMLYLGIADKSATPELAFSPISDFLEMFIAARTKFILSGRISKKKRVGAVPPRSSKHPSTS